MSLRLSEPLRNRIAERAAVEERSFNAQCVLLLEAALAGSEGKDVAGTETDTREGRKPASETRDARVTTASSGPASAVSERKPFRPDFKPEPKKKEKRR